jgi:hypothetical protein
MDGPCKCEVCARDPAHQNNDLAECSHVSCPHRRIHWSERPEGRQVEQGRAKQPRDAIERLFDAVED